MKSTDLVDAHFHVFDAGVGLPGARYVPAYDAPLAAWRRAARPIGVARGVLVQTSFLGTDNGRMLAELAAAGDALRGVAVVEPSCDAATLAALDAAGVRGIRLNLAGSTHRVDVRAATGGLWDAILALGWHVELHTDAGRLPEVLAQLPAALPVVVDHMGKPAAATAADPTVRALVARARSAPVHVKLSGAYRLGGVDAGALAQALLGELGPARLLWGSDWPCTNHEHCADYAALFGALGEWLRDDGAVRAALSDNPLRLYWR